jgi:oligopeptide transport system ATP-binding protein
LGFRCGASEAGEEVYTEYMTEADGARNNTENSSAKSILTIKDLSIHFPIKKSWFQAPEILKAVSNVDFNVYEGEILGIVGESGCGKSTLARAIVGLNTITQGDIIFTGNQSLSQLTEKEWHPLRQSIQLIFQDPIASLNPRINILDVIAEPLKIYHPHLSHTEIVQQATDIIKAVGLEEEHLYRYPQEFSGGQCQRINIARALILKPSLLICDEATSALDATTKLQIIDLLKNLKQQFNLTIIFISHDLSLLKHLSNRIIVMYLGHIMEISDDPEELYHHPKHPYTQALLSAISVPDPRIERQKSQKLLEGEIPSPLHPPKGCAFSTRCSIADEYCRTNIPSLQELTDKTQAACFKVTKCSPD